MSIIERLFGIDEENLLAERVADELLMVSSGIVKFIHPETHEERYMKRDMGSGLPSAWPIDERTGQAYELAKGHAIQLDPNISQIDLYSKRK